MSSIEATPTFVFASDSLKGNGPALNALYQLDPELYAEATDTEPLPETAMRSSSHAFG